MNIRNEWKLSAAVRMHSACVEEEEGAVFIKFFQWSIAVIKSPPLHDYWVVSAGERNPAG